MFNVSSNICELLIFKWNSLSLCFSHRSKIKKIKMNLNNPMISIIIPIYNVENYLSQCLISILKQSFVDFEIILVDDGSTDNSGRICDEYLLRDSRIKVFHKENGGVSSARNYGLDNATGEYVIFVDPDDYWCVDTVLEKLISFAKTNNLDVIRGEYITINEKNDQVCSYPVSEERLTYANRVITSYEFLKYAISGEFFIWLLLFRRTSFQGLFFETGRVFLEDMQFLSKFLMTERRCMYVPEFRFYAYRRHNESISSKVSLKKIEDSFQMCNYFYNLSRSVDNDRLIRLCQCYNAYIYCSTLETCASYFNKGGINLSTIKSYSKIEKVRIFEWTLINRINMDFIIYYTPSYIGILLCWLKAFLGKARRFVKR